MLAWSSIPLPFKTHRIYLISYSLSPCCNNTGSCFTTRWVNCLYSFYWWSPRSRQRLSLCDYLSWDLSTPARKIIWDFEPIIGTPACSAIAVQPWIQKCSVICTCLVIELDRQLRFIPLEGQEWKDRYREQINWNGHLLQIVQTIWPLAWKILY